MNVIDTVLKAISEKKAYKIMDYDTENITPFMDHMIIASTDNVIQSNAVAQNIKDRLYEAGYDGDFRIEGNKESKWLLIDLKDIVVHLFTRGERDLYQLDRLYGNCPVTEYDL